MAENTSPSGRLKSFLRMTKRFLERFLVSPLLIPYLLTSQKQIIKVDVRRWLKENLRPSEDDLSGMLFLLAKLPEYRNLYYHRLEHGNLPAALLGYLLKIIYREQSTLKIMCEDIGPGLFIQHGIATIIYAERIGANCWINQQVTVGFVDNSGMPKLGDDVMVFAGAKVLGNITLGDHVRVGANAVVVKDVPPNCTVVGVPARIVKRDRVKVNEAL
jgi:serine O-acetyltransferase